VRHTTRGGAWLILKRCAIIFAGAPVLFVLSWALFPETEGIWTR
jgi:hypothetical protein